MRLGFAIAVTVDPDVLLIDEVLAVGDEAFQHRCVGKIQEFKARGKTIVLVSHDLGSIERLCDEAVWLDRGRLQVHGETREVVGRYLDHVAREEARALGVEHDAGRGDRPDGDGRALGQPGGGADPRPAHRGRRARAVPLRDGRALRRPSRLPRASAGRGPRVRRRRVPQGRGLLLRDQHRGGGPRVRQGRRRGRGHHADRAARSGRGRVPPRRRPCTRATATRTTTTAGSTPSPCARACGTRASRGSPTGGGSSRAAETARDRRPRRPSRRRRARAGRGSGERGRRPAHGGDQGARPRAAGLRLLLRGGGPADRADGARAHGERAHVPDEIEQHLVRPERRLGHGGRARSSPPTAPGSGAVIVGGEEAPADADAAVHRA